MKDSNIVMEEILDPAGASGESPSPKSKLSQLSSTSRKIVQEMDRQGSGVISYEDAANYGKKTAAKTKQWKKISFGLCLFSLTIICVILGLFILGFELTKTTDINSNSNALISSDTGEQVTTIDGEELMHIDNFWNDDIDICGSDKDRLSNRMKYIYGSFFNEYFYVSVSYFVKHESPDWLEIHDNSGTVQINYYRYLNQSLHGRHQCVMYRKLFNGTIERRFSDYHEYINGNWAQYPNETDTIFHDTMSMRRRGRRMQGDSGEGIGCVNQTYTYYFDDQTMCWGIYH